MQEQSPSRIRYKRLAIWIVAGILLVLWAYSYWGMGPVESDVQVGRRLPEEATTIQTLLGAEGERPAVNVFQLQGGRRVEVTLTNGIADSLASMNITSPPAMAENRAKDVARTLEISYEAFDTIRTLEVGFTKRLTVDGMRVAQSARIILEEDDLRALDN
jgi:hypothetical protein